MQNVLKLVFLLGLVALFAVTALAYAAPAQPLPREVLRPVLSAVILLLAGGAVRGGIEAVFTKRYTAATGFG